MKVIAPIKEYLGCKSYYLCVSCNTMNDSYEKFKEDHFGHSPNFTQTQDLLYASINNRI